MIAFGIITLMSLISSLLYFVPFFFLLVLYFSGQKYVWLVAILLGLLVDIFWAIPFALSSLFYLSFLLAIKLYASKYNPLNQGFLLASLIVASIVFGLLTDQSFSFWHLLTFSLCFIYLSAMVRQWRKQSLKYL